MKTIASIALSMGLNSEETNDFTAFLQNQPNIKVTKTSFMQGGFLGIEDRDEQLAIRLYNEELENRKRNATKTASILISSGFSFDGYKITKYSGYVSGDATVQIPRGYACESYNPQGICDALMKTRIQALAKLKEAAVAFGCNAVIGVDFDYVTFESSSDLKVNYPYVICATANGNAVVIEKE